MKIYHLLFGFICLIMSSCNHKGQVSHDTPFNITGEIGNVEDGYMIILVKRTTGSSTDMIAIDTLINGSFSFSAAAEDNVSYHLVTPHVGVFSSMSVDIYAEPGANIKVKGDGYLIKDWIVESKVKNQKIYQSYQDLVAPMLHQMQEMELEYHRIGKEMEYLRAKDPMDKQVTDITTAWLKDQKKVSAPWLDLMYRYANAAFQLKDKELQKKITAIWSDIDPETRESEKGKIISKLLSPSAPTLNIGDTLPMNTRMYDIDGNVHTFNEFKGKTMLLYFGSYGCKPCVAAKKELGELASDNESLEIIGLNLDGESAWRSKGKSNPVKWHDFNELNGSYGLSSRFETSGIPTFVIASPEGKILDIWTGYSDGIINERLNGIKR